VPASYLCVPLVAQGGAVGILHLQHDRSESTRGSEVFETLQESQKRLALSVAAQIALSLASLRMRETLGDQSIRDSLTGLFNRRFLEESLAREPEGARRGGQSLSVALIDLDHFKNVNDNFGHDAGDEVLRSMADLFRTKSTGGGEPIFAWIFAAIGVSLASAAACRTRTASFAQWAGYRTGRRSSVRTGALRPIIGIADASYLCKIHTRAKSSHRVLLVCDCCAALRHRLRHCAPSNEGALVARCSAQGRAQANRQGPAEPGRGDANALPGLAADKERIQTTRKDAHRNRR
jgi:GGDEF domain-containing protein